MIRKWERWGDEIYKAYLGSSWKTWSGCSPLSLWTCSRSSRFFLLSSFSTQPPYLELLPSSMTSLTFL